MCANDLCTLEVFERVRTIEPPPCWVVELNWPAPYSRLRTRTRARLRGRRVGFGRARAVRLVLLLALGAAFLDHLLIAFAVEFDLLHVLEVDENAGRFLAVDAEAGEPVAHSDQDAKEREVILVVVLGEPDFFAHEPLEHARLRAFRHTLTSTDGCSHLNNTGAEYR